MAMWAIGIIVTLSAAIIGFLIKFSLDGLKNSFEQLLKRIDKISDTLDSHNKDLITVLSRNDVQSQFIDSHTDDIEELKRKITEININCAANNHRKHAKE